MDSIPWISPKPRIPEIRIPELRDPETPISAERPTLSSRSAGNFSGLPAGGAPPSLRLFALALLAVIASWALGAGAWLLARELAAPAAPRPAIPLEAVSSDIEIRRPPVDGDPQVRPLDGARYDDGSPAWGAARTLPPLNTTINPPPSRAFRDPFGAYQAPVRAAARPTLGKLPDLQKNLLPGGKFQLTKTFLPASSFVRLQALPPRRAKTDKMRS